jgi:putative transposase
VYTYLRNWRKDGTWRRIHDQLREWTRVSELHAASPSELIIDSQSAKSVAMLSQAIGYDAGKQVKGRKRFIIVDTLGLILRVIVTAANVPERAGVKQVLKQVKDMGEKVSRVHTVWADGGFSGVPFLQWVMDICH